MSVTSVDILAACRARAARANFELNGIDPDAHEFLSEDVFEFLERTRQKGVKFEVVICDPPSFANSREQLKNALRAYVSVNSSGLRVLEPNWRHLRRSQLHRAGQLRRLPRRLGRSCRQRQAPPTNLP